MSVGTWVLSASGASDTLAAACELIGVAPRLRRAVEATSAGLAPALCTFTAVPVWREPRAVGGSLP